MYFFGEAYIGYVPCAENGSIFPAAFSLSFLLIYEINLCNCECPFTCMTLYGTPSKKNLCETLLRFEGQKSALTCAQNFHWWTFLTRIKQVLNSQPNYWYLGLFKNCKLNENMHSVIVIKSQTIKKMKVFEKQYKLTLSK